VGNWRGNLLSFNETTTGAASENSGGNASSIVTTGAFFTANFKMVPIDGSSPHAHVATNFILSNVSSSQNDTVTYTGTSTLSMPEGPIADVPTTIEFSGELISILLDPSAVSQHFGNTPIYGVVLPEEDKRGGHNYGPSP
jgi:hypothetical protein